MISALMLFPSGKSSIDPDDHVAIVPFSEGTPVFSFIKQSSRSKLICVPDGDEINTCPPSARSPATFLALLTIPVLVH